MYKNKNKNTRDKATQPANATRTVYYEELDELKLESVAAGFWYPYPNPWDEPRENDIEKAIRRASSRAASVERFVERFHERLSVLIERFWEAI